MRPATVLIAALAASAVQCAPTAPAPPASAPSAAAPSGAERCFLTVATYNINWGARDLRQIAATIRQTEADVVCLQETTPRAERHLRRTLRDLYPHMHFEGHDGRVAAERFGFLSKSPLRNVVFLPPRHGLFGSCRAEVESGGRTVQIVNVHLQPVIVRAGAGLREAYAGLARTEETHAREIAHILKHVTADVPTVIAGDFNSLSTFRAPMVLKERGFVDSFAHVNENPESTPTWRWKLRQGELALRIDYIFHTEEFATRQSKVVESSASDHRLVVSRLELLPAL